MSYLRYLCLLEHSGVQPILYPMLSVYLDFPFLIAPSVFSNVYLKDAGTTYHSPAPGFTRRGPGYCL
jgi:hypothetical protein